MLYSISGSRECWPIGDSNALGGRVRKRVESGDDSVSERRLQLLVAFGLIAYAAGLVTGWLVQ